MKSIVGGTMRILTAYELDLVAGGTMTGSTNGEGGDGGSTGGGAVMPPLTTPILWQAAIEDLQQFFDQAEDVIEGYEPRQGDQNSNYDESADYAPFAPLFMEMWGLLPNVQNNPAAHYWNFLEQDVDPEFIFASSNINGVAAQFSGGTVSITTMPGSSGDGETLLFNVNGLLLRGVWHDGPPSGSPDELVVNGGHWTFDFIGMAADGMPATPPPVTSSPTGPPPVDPFAKAATQQSDILTRVDALLAANGGHFLISFQLEGGGTETVDLAEFRSILGLYSIVGSTADFSAVTGGAGQVVKLADGSYQTTIETDQLRIYASSTALLSFLIIHEVSHNLAKSLANTQSLYSTWIAGGGTPQTYVGTTGVNGSSSLYKSESYVNNIARSIAVALGLPVAPEIFVGGGYSYTGKYK